MSPIAQLKAEAAALKAEARAAGRPLKHCTALEQIAKNHGYSNWRACLAAQSNALPVVKPPQPAAPSPADVEMKRYRNDEWNFSLDIPKRWNALPAAPGNDPFEIIRFKSPEGSSHKLIIFRYPCDPAQAPQARAAALRQYLVKAGHANFVDSKTTIGSRSAAVVEFDLPKEGGTWRGRNYSIVEDTLGYMLSFGSTKWDAMAALFERMAKSFDFFEE